MIIEQLKDFNNLTDSEKLIANYLLDESNNINNMASTHLAKATFTSQSTVVRLYQKMGFQSYREFMAVLAVERKDYFESTNIMDNDLAKNWSTYDNTLTFMKKLYHKTLADTISKLDRNTVIRVCNRLSNEQAIIDIYAINICYLAGLQMQSALQSINKTCTLQTNINPYYLNHTKDIKRHVAILINNASDDPHMIEIAQTLKEYNIYSVAFVENNYCQLAKLCYDTLLYDKAILNSDEVHTMTDVLAIQFIIRFILCMIFARSQDIFHIS